MGSVGQYIFRTTFGAFLLVLISLTSVIWLTNALREVDLMTNRGQTILVFLGITTFALPQIIIVVAPIALMIAIIFSLNKLASDSELIVMNGSGFSPWALLRPFAAVGLITALGLGLLSSYLGPKYMRELRGFVTSVRADLLSTVIQPGRFATLERGFTFHIRERGTDGQLRGIFVDDRRDPKDHVNILAEQGKIEKSAAGTFLALGAGTMQRHPADQADPMIVQFDSNKLDLSQFAGGSSASLLSPRERYAWELLTVSADDPLYKREPMDFIVEFVDRMATPIYPIAFAMLAFAFLGPPRTTRQGAGFLLFATIASSALLRIMGYAAVVMGVKHPIALALPFAGFALAFGFSLRTIAKAIVIEPPQVVNRITTFVNGLFARFATA
jgi:lipopolysaccharide export system permease protein